MYVHVSVLVITPFICYIVYRAFAGWETPSEFSQLMLVFGDFNWFLTSLTIFNNDIGDVIRSWFSCTSIENRNQGSSEVEMGEIVI